MTENKKETGKEREKAGGLRGEKENLREGKWERQRW